MVIESLEKSQDKVARICDVLKQEALQPAKEEAYQILQSAEQEAAQIVERAKENAEKIVRDAHAQFHKRKELFEISVRNSCERAVASLKQQIANRLFNMSFQDWVEQGNSDPNLWAELISTLVRAVEKEGLSSDFGAVIAKRFSADQMNSILCKEILTKLKQGSVLVGDFSGGVQIKLYDRKLTLDFSDGALKELLRRHVRKEFYSIVFQNQDIKRDSG